MITGNEMDGPIWTVRVREMLGVFMFVWCLGKLLGSWPGDPPGFLQGLLGMLN